MHGLSVRVLKKAGLGVDITKTQVTYQLCYYVRVTTTPEKNFTLMCVTTLRVGTTKYYCK